MTSPPRGHLATYADNWDSLYGGVRGVVFPANREERYWMLIPPPMHLKCRGQSPRTKNYLAQKSVLLKIENLPLYGARWQVKYNRDIKVMTTLDLNNASLNRQLRGSETWRTRTKVPTGKDWGGVPWTERHHRSSGQGRSDALEDWPTLKTTIGIWGSLLLLSSITHSSIIASKCCLESIILLC